MPSPIPRLHPPASLSGTTEVPIDALAVDASTDVLDDIKPEPRRDGGYVLMLTALLIFPIVAFTGFAVDLGAWNARAAQIQGASDAAALSGVTYLPNVNRATTEARRVAAMNGFDHGVDGIEVTVQDLGNARLEVRILDTGVQQFFSSIFTDEVRIARGATAEYIKPVPLGSPRNYLGTFDLLEGGAQENLMISVSGYCARREHGDRLTPFAAANHGIGVLNDNGGNPFRDCRGNSGGGNNTIDNPEYTPEGYFYAIELDDGDENAGEPWGSPVAIEIYDLPHCQGHGDPPHWDSGANTSAAREYRYRVRRNDSLDPFSATVIHDQIITPASCNTMKDAWHTLYTLENPTEGTYYLQITAVEPTNKTRAEGQNNFALRARPTNWGTGDNQWPCTADGNEAVAGAPERLNGDGTNACPRVYALTHLGVYARLAGVTPEFYLADIGAQYEGRRLQVELFDSGEGAAGMELLDPMGVPVPVTVEIACYNGQYVSEIAGNCPSVGGFAETDPPGGRGPFNVTLLDVSGEFPDNTPWGNGNGQAQRYNDRIVRLTYDLPTVAESPGTGWYDGNTWFKLRYYTGSTNGDRTTWTIQVLGDPVRLVD